MAQRIGGPITANMTTEGNQSHPAIAALAGNRHVVAWTDTSETGGDTSGQAVRARIFSADGSGYGPEFLVNTTTAGNQALLQVATLPDSRFIVAWVHTEEDGQTSIRAQIFLASGARSGGEIRLETDSTLSTPFRDGFAVMSNGDLAVVSQKWYHSVWLQTFAQDGSAREPAIQIASGGYKWAPAVTGLPDGGLAITWTDQYVTSQVGWTTNWDWDVHGRIRNADGTFRLQTH